VPSDELEIDVFDELGVNIGILVPRMQSDVEWGCSDSFPSPAFKGVDDCSIESICFHVETDGSLGPF